MSTKTLVRRVQSKVTGATYQQAFQSVERVRPLANDLRTNHSPGEFREMLEEMAIESLRLVARPTQDGGSKDE